MPDIHRDCYFFRTALLLDALNLIAFFTVPLKQR